jgi:AbiV family abortive infection protein
MLGNLHEMPVQRPSADILLTTIETCLKNGERLLNESYNLEFEIPPSTQFFLVMTAQEEFAKAFILYLVKEAVVPFSSHVLRAINDHTCKQLVGIIMDYMIMHWDDDEQCKAMIRMDNELGDDLPNDVGSAIELLRYEKIGRWEAKNWFWDEDPNYDTSALRIAKGKKDRHKQDALYVRIGHDGRVSSTPSTITEDETRDELARANRYKYFVNSLAGSSGRFYDRDRYNKALAALKMLFAHRL